MVEPELFSDLALIHSYHTFFLCPHFSWMQEQKDLTGVAGFQAHQTLARFYFN
jgi:hypothetical protein